jgi:hypothetical protein
MVVDFYGVLQLASFEAAARPFNRIATGPID